MWQERFAKRVLCTKALVVATYCVWFLGFKVWGVDWLGLHPASPRVLYDRAALSLADRLWGWEFLSRGQRLGLPDLLRLEGGIDRYNALLGLGKDLQKEKAMRTKKVARPRLELLEDRCVPSLLEFMGSSVSAGWSLARNRNVGNRTSWMPASSKPGS
jgi:hypothetical protein